MKSRKKRLAAIEKQVMDIMEVLDDMVDEVREAVEKAEDEDERFSLQCKEADLTDLRDDMETAKQMIAELIAEE